MANDRTNQIETRTLFDDVRKNSKSSSQFGPTRIYRVQETPGDDFGRNGDLAIIDNTAETTTEITGDLIPTSVAFCQKIPSMVPSGLNSVSTAAGGASLIAGNAFDITVNAATTNIVLPAVPPVFIDDVAEAINAANITGLTATSNNTSAAGTVVNPIVAPGDSITINGSAVPFTKNAGLDYIIAEINGVGIPFITATKISNKLVISHTRGGVLTIVGPSVVAIMGAFAVSGGVLTITNELGTQFSFTDTVGTPTATMGLPGVVAPSPLVQGGTWQCFSFGGGGIAVEDNNVPIGTFDTFDFSGAGVTLTDLGSGELGIAITGGAGAVAAYENISGGDGGTATALSNDTITFNGTGIDIQATNAGLGADTVDFVLDISDLPAGVGSPAATDEIAVDVGGTTQRFPVSTVSSGITGLTVTVINGQPMLTLEDTTRANKILSIAENTMMFAENALTPLDWVRIANANDADSGYIMEFDGTIVWITGHCENTAANSCDIHLFVNAVDQGSIGTLSGGANASFLNNTLNVDFSQGDKIRLQAQNFTGPSIQDSVFKVTVKWRG